MAQTAQDYPTTFPFGATSEPYSAAHPHKGNDHPTPMRTPLIIGDTLVGYTGNSGEYMGMKYAPHLHIQAGRDEWVQQVLDPNPYEFKPGMVVHAARASQWGNYVIIRLDNGVYVCYAHLDEIVVKEGQQIGGRKVKVRDNIIAARIVFSEVKGDKFQDVHNGKADAFIISNFGDMEFDKFLIKIWQRKDSEDFRNRRMSLFADTANSKLDQIRQIVAG